LKIKEKEFTKQKQEMVTQLHNRKEIVDIIINILQVLTLKQGQK
jgi:hypothetical protein